MESEQQIVDGSIKSELKNILVREVSRVKSMYQNYFIKHASNRRITALFAPSLSKKYLFNQNFMIL